MHLVFIPYGKRSEVELLLRDMDAQKHKLPMSKGDKKMSIWIQGQVRLLPFGIYEYVCPEGDMDRVIKTLEVIPSDRYNLSNFKLSLIRKTLRLKPVHISTATDKYLWIKDNVNIIPVGIREDTEFTDDEGMYKGWTHEAI